MNTTVTSFRYPGEPPSHTEIADGWAMYLQGTPSSGEARELQDFNPNIGPQSPDPTSFLPGAKLHLEQGLIKL